MLLLDLLPLIYGRCDTFRDPWIQIIGEDDKILFDDVCSNVPYSLIYTEIKFIRSCQGNFTVNIQRNKSE